jgi:uncharacterized membrane protein
MAFCQNCGSPAEGRYCAKCGAPTGADPGPQSASSSVPPPISAAPGMSDNLAAALCYVPIIGAIFLFLEPYSRNKVIRFHAVQQLLLVGVIWVVTIALASLSLIFGLWAFIPLIRLAFFGVLIFTAIKAYQGTKIVLPVIGPLAEKWA